MDRLTSFGVKVSSLCLGCEPLGGTDWGEVDFGEIRRAVSCAWEMGITTFDTADVYGLGRSETELSAALGANRHKATIVTKFGVRWQVAKPGDRAGITKDSSPEYLTQAVEASLRRLKIDSIPLYLVHWPDTNTPLEVTIEELEKARIAGKIRAYGISNFAWDDCADVLKSSNIAAYEGPFNLVEQSGAPGIYEKARQHNVAILTYGALAQGLLTGKYKASDRFDTSDRRHRLPLFSEALWPANQELLTLLQHAAEAHSKTPAQVALRWVLDKEFVSSVIVGAKNIRQVQSNVGALGWTLDEGWSDKLNYAAKVVQQALAKY